MQFTQFNLKWLAIAFKVNLTDGEMSKNSLFNDSRLVIYT